MSVSIYTSEKVTDEMCAALSEVLINRSNYLIQKFIGRKLKPGENVSDALNSAMKYNSDQKILSYYKKYC